MTLPRAVAAACPLPNFPVRNVSSETLTFHSLEVAKFPLTQSPCIAYTIPARGAALQLDVNLTLSAVTGGGARAATGRACRERYRDNEGYTCTGLERSPVRDRVPQPWRGRPLRVASGLPGDCSGFTPSVSGFEDSELSNPFAQIFATLWKLLARVTQKGQRLFNTGL